MFVVGIVDGPRDCGDNQKKPGDQGQRDPGSRPATTMPDQRT